MNRALNAFIIDTKEHVHVDCRQTKPVHEVHANQKMKFMKLAEVCKRMQMPERIPDKYSRAISFLAAVDDDTFRKLERILEDADSISDADNVMTYEKTVKLCLLAESRLKKRISAITMAKQLRCTNPPVERKKKEPSDKDSKSKDKKKDEKRKPPKKEAPAIESKWLQLPDKIKSLTTEQREALTKACYQKGVCKNCVETDKTFPAHKSCSAHSKTDGVENGLIGMIL